jgi:RND family efflux transporter MFP subunit
MTMKNRKNDFRKALIVGICVTLGILLIAGLDLIKPESLVSSVGVDKKVNSVRLLTVQATSVSISTSYKVDWNFIGRVEAARSSDLGFEFGGLVATMSMDEGDRVKKGQTLAVLNTDRLMAKRAELAASLREAKAALFLSDNTRRRTREAYDLNAVSVQQWDEARQQHKVQKAVVRRIQAQMKTIDLDINKSRLLAPFDGVVFRRLVDEGTVVTAGQPTYRLLEMSRPEIRVGIRNDLIPRIKIGQEHIVRLDNRNYPAKVRAVLPKRNRETRTVDVLLNLSAAMEGIQDGDLAELTITDEIVESGYWLPLSALTESSRGLWSCYVAEPYIPISGEKESTHRLARRQLELLHQQDDQVYVRGTLADGELVVTEGLHRLVPDQRVQIAGVHSGGQS